MREHDLDVPFVLMTGGPAVESAVRAVEYGALRYLIKPIDATDLEEVVTPGRPRPQMARIKREALEMFRLDGKTIGDRAGLEARFASALETLWIAYQPIVSWSKRSTFAHEALVRNEEPTLALAAGPVRGGRAAGRTRIWAHGPRPRGADAGQSPRARAAVHQPARPGAGRRTR